ncbi:MAG: hypothetical protein ACK5O2_00630 [Microthrixaceae bacterium]
MASSPAAAQLTEAHRLAQARLGASTVAQLLDAWSILDPASLDESTVRWLRVAIPIVERQRTRSALLAANYARTFRAMELGTLAGAPSVPIALGDPAAIATSLTVTGPVKVKQALAAGRTQAMAMDMGAAQSASAGMRQAMAGGRQQVTEMVRQDPRSSGYARVTSGNACAFCVTLSARGAVYGRDGADFQAHDHCSCAAEPTYRSDAALPPSVRRNSEIYTAAQLDPDTTGDQINQVRQLLARS